MAFVPRLKIKFTIKINFFLFFSRNIILNVFAKVSFCFRYFVLFFNIVNIANEVFHYLSVGVAAWFESTIPTHSLSRSNDLCSNNDSGELKKKS